MLWKYIVQFVVRFRVLFLKNSGNIFIILVRYVGANVLSVMTDDALIAQWNNEGLPSDNMSIENATILTNSIKWPLIIDPQLQGMNNIVKDMPHYFLCFK